MQEFGGDLGEGRISRDLNSPAVAIASYVAVGRAEEGDFVSWTEFCVWVNAEHRLAYVNEEMLFVHLCNKVLSNWEALVK
jgi:hypothetical protein